MTRERDFKKIVRKRMGKTGESYTAARASVLGPSAAASPPPTARSKSGMYPWDMFDDSARSVLTAAQAEAVRARTGLIGPEHVLLGLVRQRKGGAVQVLRALGVRAPAVRAALKTKGLKRVSHPAGRIVPAASATRLIDQALFEAKQRGSDLVGSEHLLIGMLCETNEPATQVLAELGATAERVAELIDVSTGAGRREKPPAPPPAVYPAATGGVAAALQRGRNAAQEEGAMFFRSDHLLSQLVGPDSQTPALVDLLRAVGADVEELCRRLKAPRRVTRLESEIWRLRLEEDAAIQEGDDERARRLLEEERGLRDQLAAALDAWNEGWARPRAHRQGEG